MSRPTFEFLRYLLGRRPAHSTVTAAERGLLAGLAAGRRSVVEVGVFEGLTSTALAQALAPDGRLWLVDPYLRGTRPERLLGISYAEWIARRTVRPWAARVRFLRITSLEAARDPEISPPPELVLIDADHSYPAVRADFLAWATRLAPGGVIALHDSRICPARPDLEPATGPVRWVAEVLAGAAGAWEVCATADSVTALRRTPPAAAEGGG